MVRITNDWLQLFVEKQQVGPFQAKDLLKKLTHLKLEGKQVETIENLEACKHLRVLYLFDNSITQVQNLDFARNLTHLYLQNNQITKMGGFQNLSGLQKLYLDGNSIRCLEGLEGCPRLEELSLSRQRPYGSVQEAEDAAEANRMEMEMMGEEGRYIESGGLRFDMASIATISGSLRVLELADNGITTVAHLCYLSRLEELVLKGNMLSDVQDVAMMMSGFQMLRVLALESNPLAAISKSNRSESYRDNVFLMSETLESVDGFEITPQQRAFLQQRALMRKRREAAGGGRGRGGGGRGRGAGRARGGGGAGTGGGGGKMAGDGLVGLSV